MVWQGTMGMGVPALQVPKKKQCADHVAVSPSLSPLSPNQKKNESPNWVVKITVK